MARMGFKIGRDDYRRVIDVAVQVPLSSFSTEFLPISSVADKHSDAYSAPLRFFLWSLNGCAPTNFARSGLTWTIAHFRLCHQSLVRPPSGTNLQSFVLSLSNSFKTMWLRDGETE